MTQKLPPPEFTPFRGAFDLPLDQARAILGSGASDERLFELAGTLFEIERHLKTVLVLGKPGSGKTVLMLGLWRSLVNKLHAVFPNSFRTLTFDPAGMYREYVYRNRPSKMPIRDLTPHHLGSYRADFARHIVGSDCPYDPIRLQNLVTAITDLTDDGTEDGKFWPRKVHELLTAILKVLATFSGPDWRLRDLLVPLIFPEFLKPLLQLLAETRGYANLELDDRLGQNILASAGAQGKELESVAAYAEHAGDRVVTPEQISADPVNNYMAFSPDLAPAYRRYSGMLVRLAQLSRLSRPRRDDFFLVFADELRGMGDLDLQTGIAQGRAGGMAYVLACQTIEGMVRAFGANAANEILDLMSTVVCLGCGPLTAERVAKFVGSAEGIKTTFNYSSQVSDSNTISRVVGGGTGETFKKGLFGLFKYDRAYSTSANHSVTVSDGWTTTRSSGQSSDLFVRDMLLASELTHLPSADPVRDELSAMIFNADTGRFFVRTPFLHHFQNQGPDWLVPELNTRPSSHALLKRWDEGDLARLKLPARANDDALRKALNK